MIDDKLKNAILTIRCVLLAVRFPETKLGYSLCLWFCGVVGRQKTETEARRRKTEARGLLTADCQLNPTNQLQFRTNIISHFECKFTS